MDHGRLYYVAYAGNQRRRFGVIEIANFKAEIKNLNNEVIGVDAFVITYSKWGDIYTKIHTKSS